MPIMPLYLLQYTSFSLSIYSLSQSLSFSTIILVSMYGFATIYSKILHEDWDKKSIIYVYFYCVSFDVNMIYDLYGLHSMRNDAHLLTSLFFHSILDIAVGCSNPLSFGRQKITNLSSQIVKTFIYFLYLIYFTYCQLLYFSPNILHVSSIPLTIIFKFIYLFDLI